jgi:hypothetical protein
MQAYHDRSREKKEMAKTKFPRTFEEVPDRGTKKQSLRIYKIKPEDNPEANEWMYNNVDTITKGNPLPNNDAKHLISLDHIIPAAHLRKAAQKCGVTPKLQGNAVDPLWTNI